MVDVHTKEQRRYNMSRIRSEDTVPERMVRSWLWNHGYRYRLRNRNLPGRPDIVLRKYRTVIFVHGCFWHRHGCMYTTTPATRTGFWNRKFLENTERDDRVIGQLRDLGWKVYVVWECELKGKLAEPDETFRKLEVFLKEK
ncbi:MAG: DNA mismatch endonuclease Vsr [Planctomycetia bacterium]|nr:DNA mismatch endonuclease Vsr [Planctomycetia bacterium]